MSEPQSLAHVTWWEIPTSDLGTAQTFYSAVFGWTYLPFGEGYSGIVPASEPTIEGMIGGLTQADKPVGEGIRIYVNVADMEATLDLVEQAGGTVRTKRTEVGGDMGYWADFSAPDGVVVGLTTMAPPA